MNSYDDFANAQKIVYELKPKKGSKDGYTYDDKTLGYEEGIPTQKTDIPFVRLLEGKEPICNMERRYQLYEKNWSRQQSLITDTLDNTDRVKFRSLDSFFCEKPEGGEEEELCAEFLSNGSNRTDWKLPCGMLNLGSNIVNHGRILSQIFLYFNESPDTIVVKLSTNVLNTVKACAKMVSYRIVVELSEKKTDQDSDDFSSNSNAFKNLPEIEVLVKKMSRLGKKLIVLIEDADSLPTAALTRLLNILWHASISTRNVYIMLGLSTPVVMFEEKIPKLLLGILHMKSFSVDNSDEAIEKIMSNLLLNINDTYNSLIFDPRLVLHFLKMRSDIGITHFYQCMKLIYMKHYFSQPLSILWTDNFSGIELTDDYFTIFKRLKSVQTNKELQNDPEFCKGIKDGDNSGIGRYLRYNLNKLINWRYNLKNLIDLLNFTQAYFYDLKIWHSNLELFILIFKNYDYENISNNVANFDFLKPVFLNMQNVEMEILNKFIDMIKDDKHFAFLFADGENECDEYFKDLSHLSNHRQVEKFTKNLNEKLLRQLSELNFDNQPFREICCVGMEAIQTLTSAFNPPVRDEEINAMLNSEDYLMNPAIGDRMDEEDDEDDKIFHLFEPSMIHIYKLYREAGVVINIYDFYVAFRNSIGDKLKLCELLLEKIRDNSKMRSNRISLQTMIDCWKENGEDTECEEWDKMTLSWFLKGLVELKMKGMIKEGRNASGNVEKLVWNNV